MYLENGVFSFNQLGNLGELGNQMFQYAAIKGIASKNDREFMIAPPEIFGKFYYKKMRSNIYDCFNIQAKTGISDFPVFSEKSFHFDEKTFLNPPSENVDFSGFFQSSKWFGLGNKHLNTKDLYLDNWNIV